MTVKDHGNQGEGPPPPSSGSDGAEHHYFQGNRHLDRQDWEQAAQSYRQASGLWFPLRRVGRAIRPFLQLRAALALIATVLAVHFIILWAFPRDRFDLILLSGGPERSWWERWLDTSRPQSGDNHKMNFREWWSRLRHRLRNGVESEQARGGGVRPTVPERWADLLRRYGRWGEANTWDLDYSIISGLGLSRLGEYDSAVKVFKEGIDQTSSPVKLAGLYQGLANTHYYKGYRLQPDGLATYDLTQVSKAAHAYEQSLHYTKRPLSYGNLGWMYYLLGNYRRSEEYSLSALNLNQNLHYVRLNLGLVYLVEGRLRKSFDTYYSVIQREPVLDVYMGGINDLKEVLRDHPGRHPFAHLMVGMLALKKGDLADAHDALNRFLASPGTGTAWRELARGLLGDMDTHSLER